MTDSDIQQARPRLVIIADTDEFARGLAGEAVGLPVEISKADPATIWNRPDVDAVYVPIPYAERWGARPIVGEPQLLASSAEEQKQGLSKHIIAGVAGSLGDQVGEPAFIGKALSRTFEVVRDYSSSSDDPINSIVLWDSCLNAAALSPARVGAVLRDLYRK